MRHLRSWAVLPVVVVALAACGGPDDADPGSTPAPGGTRQTTAGAAPTTAGAAAGNVDAAKLCDFLRSEVPRLRAVGSNVGRLAQLTGHLYEWGEAQKVQGKLDLERLTKEHCP